MSLEILSAVWDLDLGRNQRDVLEVLAWHANADGLCWPSKARIMYKTSLSESTVKRALTGLKKRGLVTVEDHAGGGRGKTPLYRVRPEKGVKKPPFTEWLAEQKGFTQDVEDEEKGATLPPLPDQKGFTGNEKGGQDEHEKGFKAVTPEPSERTVIEQTSSKDFTNVTSLESGDRPSRAETGPPTKDAEKPSKPMPMAQYGVGQLMERVNAAKARGAPVHSPTDHERKQYGRFYSQRSKDGQTLEVLGWTLDYLVAKASGEVDGEAKAWCGFDTALDRVLFDRWRPGALGSPSLVSSSQRRRLPGVPRDSIAVIGAREEDYDLTEYRFHA